MLFGRMNKKGSSSLYMTVAVAVFINTSVLVTIASATHFRGGTVWWQPSLNYSENNKEVWH